MQSQEHAFQQFNAADILKKVRSGEIHPSWEVIWESRSSGLENMAFAAALSAITGLILAVLSLGGFLAVGFSLLHAIKTIALLYIGGVAVLSAIAYVSGKIGEYTFRRVCVITPLGIVIEEEEGYPQVISFPDIDDLIIDSMPGSDGKEMYGLGVVVGQMKNFITISSCFPIRLSGIIEVFRNFERIEAQPKESNPHEIIESETSPDVHLYGEYRGE